MNQSKANMLDQKHILNRFLSYVVVDTESNPNSETTPSSKKQWNLANALAEELKAMTVKLRRGDEFEIGRLKGTVVEATPQYVTFEADGIRFTLEPGDNLGEAAKRAEDP